MTAARPGVTAIKSSTAGIWDYTWPTDMPEGQHTLTVEVTDGAGNKMTETLNFTIDITLMTPTIELAPDQDTGQNKNDNLTSVTQPVFVLGSIDKDVRHVELSIEHNGTFKTVGTHRISRRLALSTGFCFGGR
ncbi:Ig domain-containing protein [Salmonella enterica subsp. enterica]|uniref:Ig domain-containing protein n=1 Tax=Salmonella enterica I TaxID=59201 RepID=A0A447TPT6_SALET|nr:Ig domain-containing protein [Salmonella enterica subsp. enterica]